MPGREVVVLAEGRQTAGRQAVTFDAAHLPAGLYVARLVVGDRLLTQPLVRVC